MRQVCDKGRTKRTREGQNERNKKKKKKRELVWLIPKIKCNFSTVVIISCT